MKIRAFTAACKAAAREFPLMFDIAQRSQKAKAEKAKADKDKTPKR